MEYKQSGWAFSPLKSPGTYVLLEDFRSRSWADGGGGGSPVFKKWNVGLLNLTDDSDLPSSGIFQAGCRRRRGMESAYCPRDLTSLSGSKAKRCWNQYHH